MQNYKSIGIYSTVALFIVLEIGMGLYLSSYLPSAKPLQYKTATVKAEDKIGVFTVLNEDVRVEGKFVKSIDEVENIWHTYHYPTQDYRCSGVKL